MQGVNANVRTLMHWHAGREGIVPFAGFTDGGDTTMMWETARQQRLVDVSTHRLILAVYVEGIGVDLWLSEANANTRASE